MVTVEIGGQNATIEGREWESGDPTLLQSLTQDLAMRQAPLYDPYPDLSIAEEAVRVYGGRIIQQDPPEHVAGRVY